MNVSERRQKLMIYLADLPDAKINELYTELKKEMEPIFRLSESHLRILEERHSNYVSSKTATAPWKEVHDRIRSKKQGK